MVKERVTKVWPAEYEVVASFKFLLRLTAGLKSLSFKKVSTNSASPVPEPASESSKDINKKGDKKNDKEYEKEGDVKAPASEVGLFVEDELRNQSLPRKEVYLRQKHPPKMLHHLRWVLRWILST